MKTTVYAVRDSSGTRISYRYRDIEDARRIKVALERTGETGLEVYRTTQDLPRYYKR